MPGHTNETISKLVVCFDVSGSVDIPAQQAMRQEVMNLLDQNLITHAVLIATDTAIQGEITECTSSQDVTDFPCFNGGGTDFDVAMEHVAKIDDAIGCIFLTDMQTTSFGKDPNIPVIWIDWNNKAENQSPPFGQVFNYQNQEEAA